MKTTLEPGQITCEIDGWNFGQSSYAETDSYDKGSATIDSQGRFCIEILNTIYDDRNGDSIEEHSITIPKEVWQELVRRFNSQKIVEVGMVVERHD